MTAGDYLRETALAIADRYEGDCADYACRLAELLLAEGRAPWIGRLHRTLAPLIARRYLGRGSRAWTTHYVACVDREVYDPIAGAPIDVDAYAAEVFGEPLALEVFLDADATARLLASGGLARALRPALSRR